MIKNSKLKTQKSKPSQTWSKVKSSHFATSFAKASEVKKASRDKQKLN